MSKRKVPAIADIIDECAIQLWDILKSKESRPNASTIRDVANTAIAIDKNNRDFQVAVKETLVPGYTDEQLEAELERTKNDADTRENE